MPRSFSPIPWTVALGPDSFPDTQSHPLLAPSASSPPSQSLATCKIRPLPRLARGERDTFSLALHFHSALKCSGRARSPQCVVLRLVLTSSVLVALSSLDSCSSHQHSHWLGGQTLDSGNTARASLTTPRKTWPKTEHYPCSALLSKACWAGAPMSRGRLEDGNGCVIGECSVICTDGERDTA